MSGHRALFETAGLFVVMAAAEVAWLGSLSYMLERYGTLTLAAMLIATLGLMVALLDATPVGDRARRR